MIPKEVDKDIDEKEEVVNSADDEFVTSDWSDIENDIYRDVKRYTNKLESEDGQLLFSDENIALIAAMTAIIATAIQKSAYPAKTKKYIDEFDKVYSLNRDIHAKLNGITPDEWDELIKPLQLQNIQITLQNLTGTGLSTSFIEPLKQNIYKNIVAGATIEDLESYMQSFIITNDERLGQLKRYSTLIARDAIYQFDGQINAYIASKYKYDSYYYRGGIIKDSRPQCIKWSNMRVLKKSDLAKEISWAYTYGNGMIPGTTPETFSVYRGGYNCRHTAVPFDSKTINL